jgi:ADP-ribose pyrophosphatase YjhB (NUDIX family)
VSAFLVVRNPKGDVLLGKPRPHRDWPEAGCLPSFRVRDLVHRGQWILPASHFLMDESPEHAAQRIARKWAGLPGLNPRLVGVESQLFPLRLRGARLSARTPANHWALCFIYEARTHRIPRRAPGWAELRFVPGPELKRLPIGRDHGDIINSFLRREPP